MPSLITSAGRFDLSAIMRAALAMCWTYRTTATGIGSANIQFRTVRVFDRSRLSIALRSVWRQARRERLTRQLAQPEASPAQLRPRPPRASAGSLRPHPSAPT